MAAPPPQKLTRREREIMDVLFGLGQASGEEIRERLLDPPMMGTPFNVTLIALAVTAVL